MPFNTINFGVQEVKVQGHRRTKLGLEAWRSHHSQRLWVEGLAEPSFSTPLGREYEGREYEENNTELA